MQAQHDNSPFLQKKFPLILICDSLQSPANIGSIFRLADSFGIEKIYFTGQEPNLTSKRMERTARSTHKYVPFSYVENAELLLTQLESENYTLLALEITDTSIPINSYNPLAIGKTALVIGEENSGVSEKILQCVATSLHIPMYGNNSSMNVATATGIALYEITKQLDASNN